MLGPEEMTDELARLRDRLHNLADKSQAQENRLLALEITTARNGEDVKHLATTMATSESLLAAVTTLTLKIDHLADTIAPVQRAVYWAATVVVGSVGLALLGLLFKQGVGSIR